MRLPTSGPPARPCRALSSSLSSSAPAPRQALSPCMSGCRSPIRQRPSHVSALIGGVMTRSPSTASSASFSAWSARRPVGEHPRHCVGRPACLACSALMQHDLRRRLAYRTVESIVSSASAWRSPSLRMHAGAGGAGAHCGPAWDCGYPDAKPSTQYTADSFAQPIRRVFGEAVFKASERVDMPAPGDRRPHASPSSSAISSGRPSTPRSQPPSL